MEVSITDLRVNRAQMRSRINMDALAVLALQMATPDPALALIVRKRGEVFEVVSGHRRWLAAMIAQLTKRDHLEALEPSIIGAYCDPDDNGWIELSAELYESMVKMVGEFNLPVTVWEGNDAEEVLLLLRANQGAELPDLLGTARAFHLAIDRDITLEELAQTMGIPVGMADAIMGIPILPPIFQDLINDRQLHLDLVLELDQLDPDVLNALGKAMERFVDQDIDPKGMDYSGRVRSALVNLRFESKAPVSRNYAPATFNKERILHTLWTKATEEAPLELAEAVAAEGLNGRQVHQVNLLSGISATQEYFQRDAYGWGELLEPARELLEDLNCATCAFSGLPVERLQLPLDLPCRKDADFSESGCMQWIPEGSRFSMRTSWSWHGGSKQVENLQQLLKEWHSQHDFETGAGPGGVAGEGEDLSGVQLQRAFIKRYMDRHAEPPFTVDHPWSTPCSLCKHRLEESPVKSAPDAPHCFWSKGRRQLRWQAFWPADAEGDVLKPPDLLIASCLQFAPLEPWSAILPEADSAAPFEREVMIHMITCLGYGANRETHSPHSRGALQFLTGRPEKATGNHRRTFGSRFNAEKDDLTDGQIWQLLHWILLAWQRGRAHTQAMSLPWGHHATRAFKIMEFAWAVDLLDEIEKGELEVEAEESDD